MGQRTSEEQKPKALKKNAKKKGSTLPSHLSSPIFPYEEYSAFEVETQNRVFDLVLICQSQAEGLVRETAGLHVCTSDESSRYEAIKWESKMMMNSEVPSAFIPCKNEH